MDSDDDPNVYAEDVADEIEDDVVDRQDEVVDMLDEVDFEDYDGDEELEERSDDPDRSITKFLGHKDEVFAVDTNSKVGLVVSGGKDDIAYVWNIDDGENIFTCDGHKDSVTCVCFSRDGKMVATGDMSGIVQVWNVETHQRIWSFETGDLEWLEWHPVASVLLAGTSDGQCWMWQIPKDNCKIFESHGVPTNTGKFLPDGKSAVVCYADGTCKILDLKSSEARFSIRGRDAHEESISAVACTEDGALIATASLDGTVKLISTSSGKVTNTYDCKIQNAGDNDSEAGERGTVECVAFSPTLPLLATGSLNGLMHIWDYKSGILRRSCKHDNGITKLVWGHLQGGNIVYTSCLDGTCRAWDARNGQLLHSYKGPSQDIYDMKLNSSGEKLVAAYADACVRIYETNRKTATEPLR